jgi:hypothetical protein
VIANIVHVANKALGPVLAVTIIQSLAGTPVDRWGLASVLGVVLGAAGMLAIEAALLKAPKRLARMRYWLDDRAAFEGFWTQDVHGGQSGNRFAIFGVSYEPDSDDYAVRGRAYTASGDVIAWWDSEQMYFGNRPGYLSYLWEGESLGEKTNRPTEKRHGYTTLELEGSPGHGRPVSGTGSVDHLLENTRLAFDIQRITEDDIGKLVPGMRLEELHDASKQKRLAVAFAARLREGAPPPG